MIGGICVEEAISEPKPVVAWSSLIRSTAVSGMAGALAGVLVGGVGGRIVMRISSLMDKGARGAITDNGNRVGEFTTEGTVELFVLALGFGVLGGVVWIASEPWLMNAGRHVGLSFGLILFAIAGTETLVADNRDFGILDPAWFNVLMFTLLFFTYGSLFPVVRRLCDRVLPGRTVTTSSQTVIYGSVLALGVPFVILTFVALLTSDACVGSCGPSPLLAGIAFSVMAAATVTLKWKQLHDASDSRHLQRIGSLSLAAAVLFGLSVTIPEILDIL